MDTVRIIAIGCAMAGALVLIALERTRPYLRNQAFFREGLFNDFFWYTLVQNLILGVIISSVIDWLDRHLPGRFHIAAGWPIGWQFLFFLVLHDFYIYWFHRWQHHSRFLWRLHEAHHSTRDVDWLSGSRSHALEILINQTVEFVPMVLLGASPGVVIWKAMVDGVWGMYIHSNIDVRSGRLQWIINGPEMHRWHHADGTERAYNKNFSTKLAVWDWIFGTAYLPTNQKPLRYGLSAISFPGNYFHQLWFAFRRIEHKENQSS